MIMQFDLLKKTTLFVLFLFQWFNLNSLLTGPELISDTYLALFLAQLQQEGIVNVTVIYSMSSCCNVDTILKVEFVQVIPYL